MKGTVFEISEANIALKAAWDSWRDICAKFGLGEVRAPDDLALLKAVVHNFSCGNIQLNFLSLTTIPKTGGYAENVFKSAEQPHDYPFQLLYAFKNDLLIDQDGHEYLLKEGCAIFLNRVSAATLRVPFGEVMVSSVLMLEKVVCGLSWPANSLTTQLISPKTAWGSALCAMLETMTPAALENLSLSSIVLSESLCCLLSLNLRGKFSGKMASHDLLSAIKCYLQENINDPQISPDTAALALGVSRRTIYNALYANGVSFFQVVQALRVKRARLLLENKLLKGKNISEIAYQVGFTNAAHFSSVFKKLTGTSPAKYRALSKGETL